jgi:hypothetical protein
MQIKKIIYMLFFLLILSLSSVGYARYDTTDNSELSALKEQILELQQQTNEIKKEYEEEIKTLKNKIDKLDQSSSETPREDKNDEIARLKKLAEDLAGEKEEEKKPEETVFKFGGLSLQQLNPEISVSGDFLAHYRHQDETRKRTDARIRGLELNFQSYLDPFSRLKATTHIHDDGEVHLEEIYMTHFSILENANLDIGRFRQQFGVINRWHTDALDQVEYPLVLQSIFGDEGLAQTGASVEWTLPNWGNTYQGLTIQITNSENERLFEGDTLGNPSMLFHYKNYRDLSRDTYFEFGLSGLFGWNDQWNVDKGSGFEDEHDTLGTQVYGVDVSFLWEPADKALYRNIEWRSELYYLNRDILAPDNSGRDNLNAWGAYSYLQTKVSRNTDIGIRADYYKPDSKNYADTTGTSLVPLAYSSNNPHRWQICPYITIMQSEWVKFRLEYDYASGHGTEDTEHVIMLQAIFAAGPHKHERY